MAIECKKRFVLGVALAIGAGMTVAVQAQDSQNSTEQEQAYNGMGPGMMGGYGRGGCGMGPGMMMGPGMGGYGMGPGMMGGYGGGYGMGPGMMMGQGMGGYGMGPGMMNLSESQRNQFQEIGDQLRKQHWQVMGKMMDVYAKLRDAYAVEKPDPQQIGDLYGQIAKLRQQMIEAHVQAHNRMLDVLTDEQRKELQGGGRGPMGNPGKRSMPGGMGNGSMMQQNQ